MKKLLYSSIVLSVFSLSVIVFQISCKDNSVAKSNATQTQTKFLYSRIATSGTWEYWTANLDGTSAQQIPISLPNSEKIGGYGNLTSDGQTLIFNAYNSGFTNTYIYSVSMNGTNLKKLSESLSNYELHILSIF